jgi:hypothetical protein
MPHLAQVNIGKLRWPTDSPQLTPFLSAVERINQLADQAPGFIWRDPDAHADLQSTADEGLVTIVNVSLWRDYAALHAFTYRGPHGWFVRRRDRWFLRLPSPTTALRWVPDAERPSRDQGLVRLSYLRAHGPTPRAFTVRHRYTAAGGEEPAGPFAPAGLEAGNSARTEVTPSAARASPSG